jgi:hypothetical protein
MAQSLAEKVGTADRDPAGNLLYEYTWTKASIPMPWQLMLGGTLFVLKDVEALKTRGCRFEDAPPMEEFSGDDVKAIEAMRPRLFDLKVGVLQRLHRALREQRADGLWEDCLQLTSDRLSASEIDWLQELDTRYLDPSVDPAGRDELTALFSSGGVTSLVRVVGHIEKEITLGTMARTKGRLLAAAIPPVDDYYDALGESWRAQFDDELDRFAELDFRERAFWGDLSERWNQAVAHEFYEEVVVRRRVRRDHAAALRPLVELFVDWQHSALERTGAVVPLTVGGAEPSMSEATRGGSTPKQTRRKRTERWDWQQKREAALHYRALRDQGLSVDDAANRVGKPRRTLDTWLRDVAQEESLADLAD